MAAALAVVGDQVADDLGDQAVPDRRVAVTRDGEAGLDQPVGARDVGGRQRPAGDREQRQRVELVLRERPAAREHRQVQALCAPVAVGQLLDEQRVAARPAHQVLDVRAAQLGPQRAHQLGGVVGSERVEVEPIGDPDAQPLEGRRGRRVAAPYGEHEGQAVAQDLHDPQRAGVGPLHVVDEERLAGQRLGDGGGDVLGVAGPGLVGQVTAERPAEREVRRPRQRREAAALAVAPAGQHGADEGRLADPRLPVEDDPPASAEALEELVGGRGAPYQQLTHERNANPPKFIPEADCLDPGERSWPHVAHLHDALRMRSGRGSVHTPREQHQENPSWPPPPSPPSRSS